MKLYASQYCVAARGRVGPCRIMVANRSQPDHDGTIYKSHIVPLAFTFFCHYCADTCDSTFIAVIASFRSRLKTELFSRSYSCSD